MISILERNEPNILKLFRHFERIDERLRKTPKRICRVEADGAGGRVRPKRPRIRGMRELIEQMGLIFREGER